MPDFLISLGRGCPGDELLRLLQGQYSRRAPEGAWLEMPWGSLAILADPVTGRVNLRREGDSALGWVGDLVMSEPARLGLFHRIMELGLSPAESETDLQADPRFAAINGAFALLVALTRGFFLVTDPLNYTPIYIGRRGQSAAAFGTHPDLVAVVSDASLEIDEVSVAEYIGHGTTSFPHTMYTRVRELSPGALHRIEPDGSGARVESIPYWLPPDERLDLDLGKTVEELAAALRAAVRDRCSAAPVGVSLSGGLDSRLVIAAVPADIPCLGLTFLDTLNREARIARRVARCYDRPWVPLFRDGDYVARNLEETVRLTGCESEFVHAHALGFAPEINRRGVQTFLGGELLGSLLKSGLFTTDIRRIRCLGGLLPPHYRRLDLDAVAAHADRIHEPARRILGVEALRAVRARREQRGQAMLESGGRRTSVAEWLEIYPYSQRPVISTWMAHRKLLPARVVGMDRRILDLTFGVPAICKLRHGLYLQAANLIYGKGAWIPNANNGVNPAAEGGGLIRLTQRLVRVQREWADAAFGKLGRTAPVQHSWHDYPEYWKTSPMIQELFQRYGQHLEGFEPLFAGSRGGKPPATGELDWLTGFRLLQLAVWKGIVQQYGTPVKSRP